VDAVATNPINPDVSLDVMRSLVRQVADRHEDLVQEFPQVLEIDHLSALHYQLLSGCDKTLADLQNPVLSIAMMGTTSSGKSTLFNGLIGRRIAPVESAEMSAGVLQIRSGSNGELCVSGLGENGVSDETHLSDRETYDQIRELMHNYRERTRTESGLPAPNIEVVGSTASAEDPSCLDLPSSVGLTFLDLPGLKSINDRKNLEVIQTTIGRSFSLVALDYNQTDQEHRQALVKELGETVSAMRRRTDLMAFVVNRIDTRSSDDVDIQDRLQLLSVEIQEVLALPEPPPVLPISGRLLYRAQCSWGWGSLDGDPTATKQDTIDYLSHLLEECASDVFRMKKTSPENRQLLNRIEESLQQGEKPDVTDHRDLVRLAREVSGATDLWRELSMRLRESFSQVVLLPAVHDLLGARDQLIGAIRTYAETNKQTTLARVVAEETQLEEENRRITDAIAHRTTIIEDRYTTVQQALQSDSYNDQLQAEDLLGMGITTLGDKLKKIGTQLRRGLGETLRDAYTKRQVTYALRDRISQDAVPADLAVRISDSFDRMWAARDDLELKPDEKDGTTESSLVFKARHDDQPAQESLSALERHLREIREDGAQAFRHAAEFLLQQQADEVINAVNGILSDQKEDVLEVVRESRVIHSIEQQLEVNAHLSLQAQDLQLPENLFEGDMDMQRATTKFREKTGEREEERRRGWWIFSWTEKYKVDVHSQIEYKTLSIPTPEEFEAMWIDAVEQNLDDFKRLLVDWVRQVNLEAYQRFQKGTTEIVEMANGMLSKRKERLKHESAAAETNERAFLEKISDTNSPIRQIRNLTGLDDNPQSSNGEYDER
jgi:GTPase SAR1 family protein